MGKKIGGILILIIGIGVFTWGGYGVYNSFTATPESLKSELVKSGVMEYLDETEADKIILKTIESWKISSSVILIIGILLCVGGGLMLFRNKQAEKKIIDFD